MTASVSAGDFGSASWTGSAWATPERNWVTGAEMSSWLFRKRIGTDPHLTGWLEVRLYSSGAVEVLPWIENGYLLGTSPTSKQATFVFTLGGSTRFSQSIDLPARCRTPLVSGTTVSHWLGANHAVAPKHDRHYFQKTKVIQSWAEELNYDDWTAQIAYAEIAETYTPLQVGNHSPSMGMAGAHGSIGVQPVWDAIAVVSRGARAYRSLIFNGYGMGRYAMHYRDETTQRPLRFSQYPQLAMAQNSSFWPGDIKDVERITSPVTPVCLGTNPPWWAPSHHPSPGYMAYLVSGWCYLMEQMQFAATVHYLALPWSRQNEKGIIDSTALQTRAASWMLRTLFQAASATPDDDPLRPEIMAAVDNNIDFYHGRFVAQPNNPFGFVPNLDGAHIQTWQHDFWVAAWGHGTSLQLGGDAIRRLRLKAFFDWTAQGTIGRFGGTTPTEWIYRDAIGQPPNAAEGSGMGIGPSQNAAGVDFVGGTGPWLANWGAVYERFMGVPNPGVDGPARGGFYATADGFWGMIRIGLVAAVSNNAPGAAAAYARFIACGAEAALTTNARSQSVPQYAVRPAD